MGQGGYVPAPAATSWSRRFGDCKGKTALLLGILHSLGIEAEPVLVQAKAGDMVADRLPMISIFNHVLVRAHISGKDYWLDGTRTGDTDLDSIQVPDFGWGLPLVKHAQLVKMVPAALTVPSLERHLAIDASSGVFAPAAITIDEIYRGDEAVGLNPLYAALTPDQRDQQLADEAKGFFDGFSLSGSSVQFDAAKRELHISIKGSAKLNWKDGWFYVPTSSIGFDPDFDRPAGPLHDVPVAVSHPRYTKDEATIRLPSGFAAQQKLDPAVHESLAGVEYERSETVTGDTLSVDSSERSIEPEVPYEEALAAAPRLRALDKDDVYLRKIAGYRVTDKDLAALANSTPGSADEYVDRGNLYMDNGKFADAIGDFTNALQLDTKNVAARADRGIAYVWAGKFDRADEDFDAALAIDPTNAVALRGRGLKAEIMVNCTAAIDFYTRSLGQEAGNSFALGHRARCENELGRQAEALADAEAALKMDPQWGDLRLLHIQLLTRAGQNDAADREIALFVSDNRKKETEAWSAIANMFSQAGLHDSAIKAFDHVLTRKPEASLYVARAQLRSASDFKGRMDDFDAALKLEPNNSAAIEGKAGLIAAGGDLKGALAVYERAMRATVGLSPLSLGRAILLYRMGRQSEAEHILSDWRKLALTASELNNLCWDQATAGILLKSAVQDCRDALKINPESGPIFDSLGLALLRLGDLDQALGAYNMAIAKRTGADSLMGRAFVYLKKGDRTHAEADADAARKLSPDIDATFAEYGLKFDQTAAPSPQDRPAASH